METPLKACRDEYLQMFLHFLWREWTALGIAGQEEVPLRHVIDPEALFLFTCSLGRYDQRLFDEVLDWLNRNGRFLNIQRIKNIMRREPFRGGRVLGAVAEWISQREDPMKWRLLAKTAPPGSDPEPLFFLFDGRPLPDLAGSDAVFLKHGLARNPAEPRGYSRSFAAETPPCHMLKMRALFGTTARSDVLSYLAMRQQGYPRQIANELYYSQKSIHDLMTDLACSGMISSVKHGRERTFRVNSTLLTFLAGQSGMPGWINWPMLLGAADAVWGKIEELRTADLDPLLESSEIALTMKPILPRIAGAFWAPAPADPQDQHGLSLLGTFQNLFKQLAA